MPKTISDEEYGFLQNKRMTADFVESIYNDPTLNKEAKKLIKRKYPNLAIPDYDMEEKLDGRLRAEDEKKAKEQQEAQRRNNQETWDAGRKKAKDEYGLTDDGLTDLEKWMEEHAVADHEVAASYRHSKNPPTSPATYDAGFWGHEKKDNFKEMSADPEAWGRKEILGAIYRDEQKARGR